MIDNQKDKAFIQIVLCFTIVIALIVGISLAAKRAPFAASLPPTVIPSTLPQNAAKLHTPSPPDKTEIFLGQWSAEDENTLLRFYVDGSYVFYGFDRNTFHAGDYEVFGKDLLEFQLILGEQRILSEEYSFQFQNDHTLILTDQDGIPYRWIKNENPTADTRHNDPIAVLFELAYRISGRVPDASCVFDPNDWSSPYQSLCVFLEDVPSGLGFGVHAPSLARLEQATALGRKTTREQLIVTIVHRSQPAYQQFLERVEWSSYQPVEDFYSTDTYASMQETLLAGEKYSVEGFFWVDDPWIYALYSLMSREPLNPSGNLQNTAQILSEILQGLPLDP